MAEIYGDRKSNFLQGTSLEDSIYGLAGNDNLDGLDGDDYLDGGKGFDQLIGNNGNDTLVGGGGDDKLFAEESDTILGNDSLVGGDGNDLFWTYGGKDTLIGGTGNDDLLLDLRNATNNITYTVYDPIAGSGTITDGAGNVITYSSIESFYLLGGSGNDDLRGGINSDTLDGHTGNDTLTSGTGNDMLYGADGSDSLNGGDGSDRLYGGYYTSNNVGAIDTLTGGAGRDSYNFSSYLGQYAYADFDKSTSGLGDYALITDFDSSQDSITLTGSGSSSIPSSSLYVLGSSPISGVSGTAIYLNSDGNAGVGSTDELLAVLQGTSNLNLTSSYFSYAVFRDPIGG